MIHSDPSQEIDKNLLRDFSITMGFKDILSEFCRVVQKVLIFIKISDFI
jgi:hypothetical protein